MKGAHRLGDWEEVTVRSWEQSVLGHWGRDQGGQQEAELGGRKCSGSRIERKAPFGGGEKECMRSGGLEEETVLGVFGWTLQYCWVWALCVLCTKKC